jgi:CRP/FNR family transcriptional regulator, anaerobic regulatory protein
MNRDEISMLDLEIHNRLRIRKGQVLYRQGDPLVCVYAIRSGMIKSHTSSEDGRIHVTAFHMPGDMLGLDSFDERRYASDATALEDTEVCVIHVENLTMMAARTPSLQNQLFRMTSREVKKDQAMLLTLGSMNAEERLAAFLLGLSERLYARGYSGSEFYLRMTREDIGNHLGIKLETVSRMMSKMVDHGLIQVRHRYVKLLNIPALRAFSQGKEGSELKMFAILPACDCPEPRD